MWAAWAPGQWRRSPPDTGAAGTWSGLSSLPPAPSTQWWSDDDKTPRSPCTVCRSQWSCPPPPSWSSGAPPTSPSSPRICCDDQPGQNIKRILVKLIFVHLEAICVKRLESVETLVSAVVLPVPPDASGPGELGDNSRHGQVRLWRSVSIKSDTWRDISLFSQTTHLFIPHVHISTSQQFNPSSVLTQHSEYPSLPFKYGGIALLVQTFPPLHFLIPSFNLN